jgi:hypothetical protein
VWQAHCLAQAWLRSRGFDSLDGLLSVGILESACARLGGGMDCTGYWRRVQGDRREAADV